MTKRSAFTIALLLCLLTFGSSSANVFARDNWTSVRSKNFLLVSNASEKDIREVGTRLERFREQTLASSQHEIRRLMPLQFSRFCGIIRSENKQRLGRFL